MSKMFKFTPPANSAEDVPVHLSGMTLKLQRTVEEADQTVHLLSIVETPEGKPVTQEWLDQEFGTGANPDFWAYDEELTPL